MTREEVLDALKNVMDVAALAGLKGEIDEERGRAVFGMGLGDNRSQWVYIRITGQNPDGKLVITFFSPCLVVKKGMFSGFSKDRAIELLQMNEQLLFARFGILEFEKEYLVAASVDALLETLDPDEFKTSCWYVAVAADNYEKKHGLDDF